MRAMIFKKWMIVMLISWAHYCSNAQSISLQSSLPWSDALVALHFDNLKNTGGKYPLLKTNGDEVKAGIDLTGVAYNASLKRGGDGKAASFDGKSWYSFEDTLFGNPDAMTFCIRINAKKSGGLIRTSLFSLVIHESGLMIAIPAIKDSTGHMYREIPLSFIRFNNWYDIVLRFQNGNLDFIVDGQLINHISIGGKITGIEKVPVMIGGWQIDNPPVQTFPKHIIAFLFQRLFTGSIDHAVAWNRALTDNEIAMISGVAVLSRSENISEAQYCLDNYREFANASRLKNIKACEQLGLSMRQFMARDNRRPVYHLTAPMDAILDPAGAFYYNGQYHVFSYRNMASLLACTPLAHFISDDLIHWKDRPISVWADSELDVYGIWLTNLFYNDKGGTSMLYTGLGKQGKIGVLAESNDSLISFSNKRAVITGLVHHDGHTWKEDDAWYSITTKQYWGQRPGDSGDAIILLTSPDLINWTERGEIFSVKKHPDPGDDNQRWGFTEYPYLLSFGDKDVLMAGTRPARYWVGRFDKSIPAFIPDDTEGKLLDYLNPFHCFNPQTIDNKGKGGAPRRIIEAMHLYASGNVESVPWYGVHVLPRVLTRNGDRLEQEPLPEAAILRGKNYHKENIRIPEDSTGLLHGLKGDAMEIIAEFDAGTAKRFGLKVGSSADGKSATKIFYDAEAGEFGAAGNLKISKPYAELGKGPAYLAKGAPVRMRIFLDHSLLEVFVNGQTCSGVFNGDVSATDIDLFSEGGDAFLKSLDVWEMKAAWPLTNEK